MSINYLLKIEYDKDSNSLKMINESEYDILVSIKPKPPKRKVIDSFLIRRGGFIIYEGTMKNFDIKEYYFSFSD